MPEIAEVQTMVNDLNQKVRGRTFIDFWTDAPKLITHPSARKFKQKVTGQTMKKARRRGKVITIRLSKDDCLLFHAKMTGHFLIGSQQLKKQFDDYYIHLAFYLDNDKILAWTDQRKFSRIELWPCSEVSSADLIQGLGPEPLQIDFETFYNLVKDNRSQIKCLLSKQDIIVGVGNIYGNEILWEAKIHPQRKACNLTKKELHRVYEATQSILKEAIKLRGTSTAEFRDIHNKKGSFGPHLEVYRKQGQPCSRCGTPIERIKVCGRSAYFCPQCQSK